MPWVLLPLSSPIVTAQTADKCAAIENAGARMSCYNPAPEPKQPPCMLSYDKVGRLYNGATQDSIDIQLGCKSELISRHGDGAYAVKMFQIIDARGSILIITANGNDRMTGYSYHQAR